jgi:hypothetical protein
MGKHYGIFFLIQIMPFLPGHFQETRQRFKILLIILSGLPVPRTYILANITAEDPVLKLSLKFRTDLLLVFNGKTGYAAGMP